MDYWSRKKLKQGIVPSKIFSFLLSLLLLNYVFLYLMQYICMWGYRDSDKMWLLIWWNNAVPTNRDWYTLWTRLRKALSYLTISCDVFLDILMCFFFFLICFLFLKLTLNSCNYRMLLFLVKGQSKYLFESWSFLHVSSGFVLS